MMIPFNHLGWFFDLCAASAYPDGVVSELCTFLEPLHKRAKLLDLGAGTGIMSRYAQACRGDFECIAADPAEGMLRYAPDSVETVNARAETLPFESGQFDAVLMGEALHHFDDPDRAVGEIARVLHSGGILFVYEFDPSTLIGGFICLAEKLLGEPGHFYTPEDLKLLLETYGFIVEYHSHGWRYTLTARHGDPQAS